MFATPNPIAFVEILFYLQTFGDAIQIPHGRSPLCGPIRRSAVPGTAGQTRQWHPVEGTFYFSRKHSRLIVGRRIIAAVGFDLELEHGKS